MKIDRRRAGLPVYFIALLPLSGLCYRTVKFWFCPFHSTLGHLPLVPMKKSFFILLAGVLWVQCAWAQDTLNVLHYNLLYYNENTLGCDQGNNDINDKNRYLRSITHYLNPDIFTCNEVGWSNSGQAQNLLLDSVLNTFGETKYNVQYVRRASNSDITNGFYYNSEKLGFVSKDYITGDPRAIDVMKLYYKDPDLAAGADTTYLYCLIAHFLANDRNSATDENRRNSDATKIVNYINNLGGSFNILLLGDLNLSGSGEAAWATLTDPNKTNALNDPLMLSNWSSSSQAYAHTQSTVTGGGCKAGGGLDDRLDFILASDYLMDGTDKMEVVLTSYKAVGNDAKRYNESLTSSSNPNTSEPDSVIQALQNNSDHLPVLLQLAVDASITSMDPLMAQGPKPLQIRRVCRQGIELKARRDLKGVKASLYDLSGKLLHHKQLNLSAHSLQEWPLNLAPGMYLLHVRDEQAQWSYRLVAP